MIKVGFNVSPLQNGHSSRGMGMYTRQLLAALKQRSDLEIKEFTNEVPQDVDLIHYPFFDLFINSLQISGSRPVIVTVPDITPLLFPKHYPPGIKGKINLWKQKRELKKAAHIITLSEASKKDIVTNFKVAQSKVSSVHLAPAEIHQPLKDKTLIKKVIEKYELPDRFFLYVGSVNWNKNINGMAEAAIKADVQLVCVGKGFETQDNLEHPELQSLKLFRQRFAKDPHITILGYVEDSDLVAIENAATALLFTTYYEGFGLPVLEAQKAGLPVITSNISSLPEIAGDGALLVDPYDVQQIAEALIKLSTDSDLRTRLSRAGLINVQRFSWQKTAQETADVYHQVVSQ